MFKLECVNCGHIEEIEPFIADAEFIETEYEYGYEKIYLKCPKCNNMIKIYEIYVDNDWDW
jgi:Zn ribbon nucleic-acid-binding protein